MEILQTKNGTELTIAIKGELNSTTYAELDKLVASSLTGLTSLTFELKDLSYISSAGLRVLLVAKKIMDKQNGKMVVRNANEDVMDIFDMTGFSSVLDFE